MSWDVVIFDAELAAARADAESRMGAENNASTVIIRRKTGQAPQNETTGEEASTWVVVHTDLPFRSGAGSSGDGGSKGVTISGVTFEEATGIGHFPAETRDLQDDDYIEVTDGEWAGDVFRIVAAIRYDQKTARRLPIVEADRPGEWV